VALSLVLLVGAGLMIKSFWRLGQIHPGFRAENVLTMEVPLSTSKYPERRQMSAFFQQVIQKLETVPGVEAVGAISAAPLTGGVGYARFGFNVDGAPAQPAGQSDRAYVRWISPNYFRAMGIPLRAGRDFDQRDQADAAPAVVIDATMAARIFPNENPIGKRLRVSYAPDRVREIVGVVGEVRQTALEMEPAAHIYVPYWQEPTPSMTLVARTTGEPIDVAAAARLQVWAVDKDQPIARLRTMEQLVAGTLTSRRFNMLLLIVFAATALMLAAVGLYGVMAYTVTQRTREIGVRVALGAQARDVVRLVIGQGMKLALIGVAMGIAGAWALTRVMSSLLFDVSATDPATFVLIGAVLTGVAGLACYLPARRAAKVDPMVALRYE
jgi:putative ABC transport system permease protein